MDQQETLRGLILSQHPTEQQRCAIFAEESEFLLRASPGSGKTWTSCRRFIWRAANWPHSVGGLALLSFTNAAIREFEQATVEVGRQGLLSEPNYLGTFDAFVERFILTPFGHLLNGSTKRPKLFTAPRPVDRSNTKLRAWTDNSAGRQIPVYAWDIVPYMENGKGCFRTSKDLGGKKLTLTGTNPVQELMNLGYYTHSHRAYWACKLLIARPHIADRLAMRFPEIIVDEGQDTNASLLDLLNFLRQRGAKITLVGDPDQCIYSFAMADATSLSALKEKWHLVERPLSKSFRCNDHIASAVARIGGNANFTGSGETGVHTRRAFIVRQPLESSSESVTAFQSALVLANLPESSGAIICRAHDQLQSVRGKVNYSQLRGAAKRLAEAAFFRDCRKDYRQAFDRVEEFLRATIWDDAIWQTYDESPDAEHSRSTRLEIWRFVKADSGLPPVTLGLDVWISSLKDRLGCLILKLGVQNSPNLGQKIQKRGLSQSQLERPMFQSESLFPAIRQETIHKVKGESIDAVLVLGSTRFWNSVLNSVIKSANSEDRRLAYVAMSRARHLLVVSLPAAHFEKYSQEWIDWGFVVLDSF